MKKVFLFLILFFILSIYFLLNVPGVYAVCPVCTVAVGAGLGISRALGVDDIVTSVWIGGLVLSMSFWFIDFMNKKYPSIKFRGQNLLLILFMYIITLVPLILTKVIGLSHNKIFGIDKIIFGTVTGSIVFLFAKWADQKVRQTRGKQFFNYQRVIFPISLLLLTSVILDLFITKYSL